MVPRGRSVARIRALLWQGLAIALVCGAGAWLVSNTLDNLARRGIAAGFGFLDTSAGFGITTSLIDYSEESSFARAFLVGLLNTLLVSAVSIVVATVIGFTVGIGRLSSNWLVARLSGAYVELMRNIPLLLQIFFWYFAVLRTLPSPRAGIELGGLVFLNNRGLYIPWIEQGMGGAWYLVAGLCLAAVLFGKLLSPTRLGRSVRQAGAVGFFGLVVIALISVQWNVPQFQGFNFTGGVVLTPELLALAIALSTYTAAFIAEVVRAGVQSVPRGQVEAAQALGLKRRDIMRSVILPQALRLIIPPLTNQYLNLTKNSSLAAAIAYPDLVSVFAGTVLNITGQAVEVIAITMAVYLVISLVIAGGMNVYNSVVALKGGGG